MSDDALVIFLEKMLENTKKGLYSEEIKNEIIENNQVYITGKRENIDPESLKYFFTGWWIHQHLKGYSSDT